MIQVNAMGDPCPIPVVKTKKALEELHGPGVVQTLVDNEIAVQNLTKMANQKQYAVKSEKLAEGQFQVTITVEEGAAAPDPVGGETCAPANTAKNIVVAISSREMGVGGEELGRTLIKGFIYALTQQDTLPRTMLFYNGGAALTCEESPALDDLHSLEAQGVEILTCGTCLNFYGLTEKLKVGEVTNMYTIAEKLLGADLIVKP